MKIMHRVGIISTIVYVLLVAVSGTYNPFVDNIPFSISWQGPELPVNGLPDDDNAVVVMTKNQEKYRCTIPVARSEDERENDIASYTGPSEHELLKPLFDQTTCSYRIESYWTYELCHGKTLRQYHEEKDANQKTKLQQYFLGNLKNYDDLYKDPKSETSEAPSKEDEQSETEQAEAEPSENQQAERKRPKKDKVPFKKVEGVEIPYYEVILEDGTLCDLTGNPRRAAIQYVCQPDGTGEIYELKETFTCEYEVIVLTSTLCSHPLYQVKKDPINQILCHPMEGAPALPVSLKELQAEQSKAPYNRRDFFIDLGQNEEAKPQELPRKVQFTYKPANKKAQKPAEATPSSTISSTTDKQVLDNFLKGEYCIHGGTGWWKHEFCYGKHVNQYHVDSKTGKIVIPLGLWNLEAHLNWLENNPNKKPKKLEDRKYVSQHYGNGDVCDLTGKPRQTEVKLKCVQSPSQPHAISIYLIEPSACFYLLVVESQLFCDLVMTADHNGLFP